MKLAGHIPVEDSVSTGEFYARQADLNKRLEAYRIDPRVKALDSEQPSDFSSPWWDTERAHKAHEALCALQLEILGRLL